MFSGETSRKASALRLLEFGALTTILLAAGGCTEIPVSQILVRLHAHQEVAPGADRLRVTVTRGDESIAIGPRVDPIDRRMSLLATLPLVPEEGDARRTFAVLAELLQGEEPVATVRVTGGYVEGELRVVNAWFDAECVGMPDCGPGRTCSEGRCVASCFSFAEEESAPVVSRPSCGECSLCVGGSCEPVMDGASCGCDGDRCQAGACQPNVTVGKVDLHSGHACAAGNRLYCWGTDHAFRVPETTNRPAQILDLVSSTGIVPNVRDVATSSAATCVATTRSGPINERYCWGWNDMGLLAIGVEESVVRVPTLAPPNEPAWLQVEAGLNHYCALSTGRELYCWGGDGFSVGKDSPDGVWSMPTRISDVSGFIDIGTSWQSTCALHEEGWLLCFGLNDFLELGRADAEDNSPRCLEGDDVAGPGGQCATGFTDVAIGNGYGCGIQHGQLVCWGSASPAVRPGAELVSTPQVVSELTDWEQITVGTRHVCALRDGGRLYCWGQNEWGQLGLGDLEHRATAEPVFLTEDQRFSIVVASGGTTCAITMQGALYCWGKDTARIPGREDVPGLLGLGPLDNPRVSRPRRVCIPPAQ